MATIPMDVIQSCILTILPVKSLLRFKCVCKSWRTLILSLEFIGKYHRRALSSNANRHLIFTGGNSDTLNLHRLNSSLTPPLVVPILQKVCQIKIIASSDFFLLADCYYGLFSTPILLNPTIGSYFLVPYDTKLPYNSRTLQYSLCYDDANNDQKVVRITASYEYGVAASVYSLKNDSWKLIAKKLNTSYCIRGDAHGVVSGNLVHSTFSSYDDTLKVIYTIGCFDMLAEQWTNDVSLPLHISNLNGFKVTVFDGLLCLSGKDRQAEAGTYSVWVMKEYGVQDSWVKLMSIVSNTICCPVAYRREGSKDELLCVLDGKTYWCNLITREVTSAEFYGVPGDGGRFTSGHICKDSLIEFPGGQSIWSSISHYGWPRGKMCKGRRGWKNMRKWETVGQTNPRKWEIGGITNRGR